MAPVGGVAGGAVAAGAPTSGAPPPPTAPPPPPGAGAAAEVLDADEVTLIRARKLGNMLPTIVISPNLDFTVAGS